jgi:CRISPR-associated endonuclease/helicase Cas3
MNKKYLAHLKNDSGDFHYLDDHLKSVGKLAERYICEANAELCEQANWAGLLHDLGKYRDEFQEYMKSEGLIKSSHETHHAVYGAALAESEGWNLLAFAIAGHHAGLHNFENLKELIKNPNYQIQTSKVLEDLQEKFELELSKIPKKLLIPDFIKNDNFKFEFATRMLFSALIDADRFDTAQHANNWKMPETPKLNPTELLEKLAKVRQSKSDNARKNGIDEKLLKLRNKIFDDCLREAAKERGFFSLTVPTGGAKTLSAMAFALKHAEIYGLRRIIVVIPYLSIIEQNAKEYRDAFGGDVVIENHSAVEVEEKSDDKDDLNPLTLITENWDAPIIVTTSVQFIESLFARKPSRCRKLHNIANSVVIFDEIQTLPAKLLEPLFSVWKELKENYGVSFVFSTATQPAFRKQNNFKNGFDEFDKENPLREITSDTKQIYQDLNRVDYDFTNLTKPQTWQEIAAEMRNENQILCVVNTRKHAFELWNELSGKLAEPRRHGIYHLSSAMCAEHRLQTIEEIKERLKNNQPCQVVSTQLVEAGVDLDFPVLFRAIAPLNSIVQAAGRCNREGKLRDEKGNLKKGLVKVFTPENNVLPKGTYKAGTKLSGRILPRINSEKLATDYTIFSDYFSNLYDDAVDEMAIGKEIQQDRKKRKFKDVAFKTKVIDDSGTPVIVHFKGKERDSSKIIKEITEKHSNKGLYVNLFELKKDMRKLQRFMVNLREKEFNELKFDGKLEKLLPNNDLEMYILKEENVMNKKNYDDNLGVCVKEFEATDFIV